MNKEEIRFQQARERVVALRGFYIHLVVYVLVNTLLFLIDITTSPEVLWFYWVLLGWGIGLVAHAASVFSSGRWLGPDWEEKKTRETMEEYDDTVAHF